METNYKNLGQILQENSRDIAMIGKSMMEEDYIVIPESLCGKTMSYNEAMEKASNAGVPVCIVKVMGHFENGKKYGIVRHPLSRLNGKKVALGRENKDGLIRCVDLERSTNVEYVHKSFIQII